MTYFKYFFQKEYLKNIVFTIDTLRNFLAFNGLLFVIFKILYSVDCLRDYYNNLKIDDTYALLCHFFICFIMTSINRRPIKSEKIKIEGVDSVIEISIGDIFSTHGTKIIPTNTCFATTFDNEIISPNSLQGKFQNKFFSYSKLKDLDILIDDRLSDFPDSKIEDTILFEKKYRKYKFGTCIPIPCENQKFILFAMADLNNNGITCNVRENLKKSLDGLWEYFHSKGVFEDTIVLPIFGTRFGRTNIPLENIIKLIAVSFVNVSKTKKITKKLQLVIYEKDFFDSNIKLYETIFFIQFICKNPSFLEDINKI